jgi:hypothetical protein
MRWYSMTGMGVLQESVDLERCVPGPHSETYPTSPHDAYQAMNIKVEDVSEIKEEEDPIPVSFPAVKAEHEVSWLSTTNQISQTIYAELPGVFPFSVCLPLCRKNL